MKIEVQFPVADVLEALDLQDLPQDILEERDVPRGYVELEADIDDDDAFAALPDNMIDSIVEDELASKEPDPFDLRDGLRALTAGDHAMASILLCRAFDHWPEAVRTIEDALRQRPVADARQPALLFP